MFQSQSNTELKKHQHTCHEKQSNCASAKITKNQWSIYEEGKYDQYIRYQKDFWIADILFEYGYKVAKGCPTVNHNSSTQHSRMIEVTPRFVRNVLRREALRFKAESGNERNETIFNLLRFVIRDGAYQDLMYVPLVPIQSDEFAAFGNQTYYLAARSDLKILPRVGPSTLIIDDELPPDLREVFNSTEFQRPLKVTKFGVESVFELLRHERIRLPIPNVENWDPYDKDSLINKEWIVEYWNRLSNSKEEFERSARDSSFKRNLPVPIINFADRKISYNLKPLNDIDLPILRTEKHPNPHHWGLLNILDKLGILFTDLKLDCHQVLIKEFNPANIIRAVEQLRLTYRTNMEKLFQCICDDERDKIREYITHKWKILTDKRNECKYLMLLFFQYLRYNNT